jgi:hypothetical protein
MKFKVLWMAGLMLVATAGQAKASFITTAEFEGVAPVAGAIFNSGLPRQEAGMSFSLTNLASFYGFTDSVNTSRNNNGTDGLVLGNGSTLTINPIAPGMTFDFISFGAVDLHPGSPFGPGFASHQVTGYLSGGGTVVANFDLVNDQFQTFNLPGTFVSLESVQIRGALNLDSVLDTMVFQTAAVPEPASIAMWGIGAIGAMCARRKRQQKNLAA